jgi:hypothetical protein
MPDAPIGGKDGLSVDVRDDGRRLVSIQRAAADGTVLVLQHDFPDAVRHHYRPAGIDEDVLLYRGQFSYPGDQRSCEGDVRFSWRPSPSIKVRGERPASLAALHGLLSAREDQGMWVEPDRVLVELADGVLPDQPGEPFTPRRALGESFQDERLDQELGQAHELEQVTFLVPNGWQAHDATGICDPVDLARTWYGRAEAAGGGWTVTLDRDAAMDSGAWRELKESGGCRFTHIGRLTRADGSAFAGQEAQEALDRVRLGLNLALGRRITCALPVGWRGGRPVWSRWRSAPADTFRSASHLLDETVCRQQIEEVVSRVLAFTADPARREALRHAISYYLAANVDVNVDLSVAIPLSGLQLLAYFRFVTEGTHSRTQWENVGTDAQLRLLIDELRVDTSVPAHFAKLLNVQSRLARNAPPRDALGLIIKMRNVVTHPTRDQPGHFSIYEWAEAGMLARYWLCLALLHAVGYQGQVAATMQARPRMLGQVHPVPWVSASGSTMAP